MVTSLEFLIALFVSAAVFPLLPGVRVRQVFLSIGNLVFLYLLLPDVSAWMALALFLGSGYGAAVALRWRPIRAGFVLYLIALLTVFAVLKGYDFLPPGLIDHPIAIVGLSYMLFRQIHFVVDTLEAQTEGVTLWNYANYQLNLFALLAGPIQRYQDFSVWWHSLRPENREWHDLLGSYLRILIGVIKAAGVGAALWFGYEKFFGRLVEASKDPAALGLVPVVVDFAAVLYLYPLYMYFNFSGYCDIVIGGASLFGIRLPENFDRPWLSRNILDFWTRWHRTLGFWIRDYLFTPLYKLVAERSPQRAPSLAFACYFIAFVMAGIWHGSTSNFLVFGVMHGTGASAAKLWEMSLVKRRGRPYLKQYLQSRVVRLVAIAATLHFVALSMLFFPYSLERCLIPIRVLIAAVGARLGSEG